MDPLQLLANQRAARWKPQVLGMPGGIGRGLGRAGLWTLDLGRRRGPRLRPGRAAVGRTLDLGPWAAAGRRPAVDQQGGRGAAGRGRTGAGRAVPGPDPSPLFLAVFINFVLSNQR